MRRVALAAACAIVASAPLVGRLHAQPSETPVVDGVTYAGEVVVPIRFNDDVRTLAPAPSIQTPAAKPYRRLRAPPAVAKSPIPGATAEAPASISAPLAPMPSPTQNFPGLNFNDSCTGGQCGSGWPPD